MQVGIGYSDIPDSTTAGRSAAQDALRKAGRTDPCDLVMLFCTARHDQQALRQAVSAAVGAKTPIYGGGAVGVITNDAFGYAGDQVGVMCLWLDGTRCDVLAEPGLLQSEADTGERLGRRLAEAGVTADSPVMLFYDAVNKTPEGVSLLMATWLLEGLQKGLGFFPNMVGAGMQGDHVCSPAEQYLGGGIGDHHAMAFAFSDDIQLDAAIMHGCRPASQYYTVTRAEGPVILEINGKPAIPFMQELLGSAIAPEAYPFFLLFGINHGERWGEYNENNYASRLCLGIDKARDGIVMFEPDMVEGTEFQLMFRSIELDYMRPKIEALFDQLDGREPVFALYIDCAGRCAGYGGLDIEDAVVLQKTVDGRVPLLGLYTGVEIAQMGGRPRGLDWTGVFCLFSKKKAGGQATVRDSADEWMPRAAGDDGGEIPLDAAIRLCEQNAAKVLELDTQAIALRHELEQKRRGFGLLAELAVTLRRAPDYESAFIPVARRINAALNMQKTAVLIAGGDGLYTPAVLQGFDDAERARLAGQLFAVDAELLDPERSVLVTAADPAQRLADLRDALGLPYFISCAVALQDEVVAILITGRMAEAPPFLSRLGRSDEETVQAISALLASVLVRQRLDEAEERAHLMLDATPLCANFWDNNHSNIDCNLEAVNLFGLRSKQEYLDRFPELSPEFQPDGRRSQEAVREKIEIAFREGRCVFEWMHQTLEGEEIPSQVTLVRVKHRDAYVVIGYTRDLRELKATLAEMERAQEALREARDRAEESSRAKTQFLANMSHEIRTPMNAIIGMTEIAKGSDDMERTKYCLDKIHDASGHLLGVINDILDMSKIDAGKFVLSEAEFATEDMLQRVCDVINFRLDEKRQSFIIKVDNSVPSSIIADQQRLSQVITNLLSNAVKFTPEEGKVTLLMRKIADQGATCTLHIEVIDTGIGISSEQQAKLFQSFEQADGSISRRFGGTGLGLAISKNIIEMMGGHIWVESEPQVGSKFRFTVQVKKGQSKGRSRPSPTVDWKGIRILVVDDSPDVLEYFEDIAAPIGITCRVAQDAYAACDILQKDTGFDVIFVDWMMPGMDGIELAHKIREKYGEHLVVVMISAVSWPQIEEKATAAGINRFLPKPLLPSLIVDCINECVETRHDIDIETKKRNDKNAGIFAGKSVLLVEDVEINQEIVISLLEETGVLIECANNGRIACEMFSAHPERYDLILMDIHMPEMDGYQATRKIRDMDFERARTIPIVAMTANVFREDIERCLATGMNEHVGKPLDIDEVLKKLKHFL